MSYLRAARDSGEADIPFAVMNPAEKIAATYLRLNGFLLLPHFTVFEGRQHGHVDLVGLRAARSCEESRGVTFPLDESFFDAIGGVFGNDPRQIWLGLVAEVRTNNNIDRPEGAQIEYVRRFLGGVDIVPVAFSESVDPPQWSDGCVEIGNAHALLWIFKRIAFLNDNHERLSQDR
jgi:hypothetical protein